jgi:hypothetical protein
LWAPAWGLDDFGVFDAEPCPMGCQAKSGTIKIHDQDGKLFKSIDLEIDYGFVLPSV